MNERLPPRPGEWIDRQQPVEFRFEGRAYEGFAGDVLSSALWANGVRLLGRSFKYHRPRGVYSLANHDINVLVEDGRHANLRGDVLAVTPGLDVRAVNTIGGLAADRLKITERFSHFLPVGFYYKGFHTPRWLFPFYENQMRKVAGLGKINPENTSLSTPKDYAFCDLLVVGGGPAGLATAVAAAEQDLDVLLVDEQPRLGGSLAWQWTDDSAARSLHHSLLEQVQSHQNLHYRTVTQAAGYYSDHWVALVDQTRLTKLRAQAMVVAAGCFEQPAVFQHNDLPGVMLGSAAQRLMHLYAVKPARQATVLTANPDGYRVALDLHANGVVVAGVVDLRPAGEPSELAQRVHGAGIDVHTGWAVYEAIPARGKQGIRGAVLCPIDSGSDLWTDSKRYLECDAIVMSVGWSANASLVYQAGGRFEYSEQLEQFVPQRLPAGVFVAGRANGIFDLQDQIVDGRRAGLMAAAYLGKPPIEVPAAPQHRGPPPSHAYPIFAHPGKKNFVDLDEDIHLTDFVNAHREGYDNIELTKRYTTVGMGPSQGKLWNMNAVRILARLNGDSIDKTGSTTSRPFHQPVSLDHLAGRSFHPHRRTAMHDWHQQARAEMIYAGSWLRPEYYRIDEQDRDDCIYDEALNVRERVGLIDVSTLGKLQINGPDAARFLERVYTGLFNKQLPGRLRYGLACDELGIIIEDGVVARLAEDRYYVTATSSGAATFYRELQRWAMDDLRRILVTSRVLPD